MRNNNNNKSDRQAGNSTLRSLPVDAGSDESQGKMQHAGADWSRLATCRVRTDLDLEKAVPTRSPSLPKCVVYVRNSGELAWSRSPVLDGWYAVDEGD